MVGISGAGLKFQRLVPSARLIVLRVDEKGPNARDFSRRNGSEQGVLHERPANALSLLCPVDSQAGKQHNRNRMPGEPLADSVWRCGVFHRSGRKAVVGDHNGFSANDIGSGAIGPLTNKGESLQKAIKQFLAAVESGNIVRFVKRFDWRQCAVVRGHSSTLFSESSLVR